jgi:hypothetical protein
MYAGHNLIRIHVSVRLKRAHFEFSCIPNLQVTEIECKLAVKSERKSDTCVSRQMASNTCRNDTGWRSLLLVLKMYGNASIIRISINPKWNSRRTVKCLFILWRARCRSTVETLVYNCCLATQQWKKLLFSLGSVPVMTSYNSRGIGDCIFFMVCSRAI